VSDLGEILYDFGFGLGRVRGKPLGKAYFSLAGHQKKVLDWHARPFDVSTVELEVRL